MEWKIGDKLRILDASNIITYSARIEDGGVYDVINVASDDTPLIRVNKGNVYISEGEMPYVERVTESEDYVRNTELGEPSADCNCEQLAEIREELTDIKSMIGRLLQREQSEKEDVWTKLRKGTDEFNRITEERKKMNGGDE